MATYLSLPAVPGAYASAPDSVALSITGDIDIRAKVRLDDWTAAAQTLVAKWLNTGSQFSYILWVDTGGFVKMSIFKAATVTSTSSAAVGLAANTTKWIRGAWNDTTDVVKFYTSDDGSTWTQLGTDVSLVSAGILDSTATLAVGGINSGLTSLGRGQYYNVQVRNNVLDNGTGIQFNADFTSQTPGARTFTESSTNAATVTINGVAKLTVTEPLPSNYQSFKGGDGMSFNERIR